MISFLYTEHQKHMTQETLFQSRESELFNRKKISFFQELYLRDVKVNKKISKWKMLHISSVQTIKNLRNTV